jgi:hypothetical protein
MLDKAKQEIADRAITRWVFKPSVPFKNLLLGNACFTFGFINRKRTPYGVCFSASCALIRRDDSLPPCNKLSRLTRSSRLRISEIRPTAGLPIQDRMLAPVRPSMFERSSGTSRARSFPLGRSGGVCRGLFRRADLHARRALAVMGINRAQNVARFARPPGSGPNGNRT